MKKRVLENSVKFIGKYLWFAKFSKAPFFQNTSGFFVQRYLVLPTIFAKPQMNIHYLETLTLEVQFRYIISFFGRINFQCMSSLVCTVYCQKQPSE